ncbi:MAG: flagellar biosynthetic protein FliO [Methylococcaceae bacterium]|nr:flagellar biosynthetic protein FliO [Methylococcaceae bacterium]
MFKEMFLFVLMWWPTYCLAEEGTRNVPSTARATVSANVLNWSLGLLIVLSVFFLSVWAMRKLNGLSMNRAEQMRIVGALSLGMREKIILLQVGKKQLILGVTPGRIEKLHVLENDECLIKAAPIEGSDGFANKLMQAMKGQTDA